MKNSELKALKTIENIQMKLSVIIRNESNENSKKELINLFDYTTQKIGEIYYNKAREK